MKGLSSQQVTPDPLPWPRLLVVCNFITYGNKDNQCILGILSTGNVWRNLSTAQINLTNIKTLTWTGRSRHRRPISLGSPGPILAAVQRKLPRSKTNSEGRNKKGTVSLFNPYSPFCLKSDLPELWWTLPLRFPNLSFTHLQIKASWLKNRELRATALWFSLPSVQLWSGQMMLGQRYLSLRAGLLRHRYIVGSPFLMRRGKNQANQSTLSMWMKLPQMQGERGHPTGKWTKNINMQFTGKKQTPL